jgi:hypothetical protein
MSIKDLLSNQYRYPLPAPPPYFADVFDTNSMVIQTASQYVNVTGIPNPAPYGITNPSVQVSIVSTGVANDDVQLVGWSDYNPSAGTLAILVNNVTDATTRFLIFISQSTDV